MKERTHLTLDERYQIEWMHRFMWNHGKIAQSLGRSRSTIDREIERNAGPDGYKARKAHRLARARLRSRARANARKIEPRLWPRVHELLSIGWTPDQISGWLRTTEGLRVSYESIYTHIYADKSAGGQLWKLLPCQKLRRKRYGAARARRHLIPNRVGIEHRPAIVDLKRRIGDWEGDTLADASHTNAVLTIVERRSMYIVIEKVPRRTTEHVCNAIVRSLKALGAPVHTLTLDNGAEFCGHERITQALGTRCYFARPYAAWQRGLNENHNALIRRYIPKRSSLAQYTQSDLDRIAHALNNRPRKTLGYRTPNQLILEYFARNKSALRS